MDKLHTEDRGNDGARIVGNNGERDGRFWYKTGLSLITGSPTSPMAFLEEFEDCCIPASQIATGDLVVFFQGDQLFWKDPEVKTEIDTSRLNLLRLGVAYTNARDQIRVISQDSEGNVWDHPVDQLPGYENDDWDFYGLHLRPENTITRPDSRWPRPLEVIETWHDRSRK